MSEPHEPDEPAFTPVPLAVPDVNAPMVDWAQYYASLGWPVFPCRGKAPLTKHGFRDATTDPFDIGDWWRQFPDANIGIPCGLSFWALDVDPRNGGDTTLFLLERQHGLLPHTLLSITGRGGYHYLWKLPVGYTVINKAEIGDGLDVQGAGSYIIVPPSVHPETQNKYLWDVMDGPADIMPQDAPEWLLALVTTAQASTQSTTPSATQSNPVPPVDAPILQGSRNKTLFNYAAGIARAGLSYEPIFGAIKIENQRRCQPPLSEVELHVIAGSAARYRRPMLNIAPADTNGMGPGQGQGTPAWGTPQPAPQLTITDLADMLDRTYPLPTWLIDKLIPEGLIFFIGSPKSSKTYLGYSLALALAYEAQRGGKWLGHYTMSHPGTVVYITLEDDEADSRLRIAELAPWLKTIEPGKLLFVHGEDFPRFDQGLVEVLRDQILERYHPALVVLDPISYLYSTIKRNGDLFAEVKNMLLPLRWLGRKYHCTIAGVDHRRKQTKDDIDIFETQYGSGGKQAIADAMFVIVRDDKEITVHARLRKAQDQTLTLTFDFLPNGSAVWTLKGAVDGLLGSGQYSDLRMQVLNALSGSGLPLSIQDLLAGLNIPDSRQTRNSVFQILFRAQKSKEVEKTDRGKYVWTGGN